MRVVISLARLLRLSMIFAMIYALPYSAEISACIPIHMDTTRARPSEPQGIASRRLEPRNSFLVGGALSHVLNNLS